MNPQESQKPHATPLGASPAESSDRNLPKAYDPSAIEQRWADYWVRERLFEVETPTNPGAPRSRSDRGVSPHHPFNTSPTTSAARSQSSLLTS